MNKLTKFVTIPLLGVVALVAVVGITAQEPSDEVEETATTDDPASPFRYFCRYAIEQVLHDPSSAEWIDYREWPAFFRDDEIITVTARYRATNALGATVTEQTVCDMRHENDEYRLIEFR